MHKVCNHATQIGFQIHVHINVHLAVNAGVQLLHINVHLVVKELIHPEPGLVTKVILIQSSNSYFWCHLEIIIFQNIKVLLIFTENGES